MLLDLRALVSRRATLGGLIAGAYGASMSSNYNGARKPAVLWLEDGQVKLIQKRETIADLMRRDADLISL